MRARPTRPNAHNLDVASRDTRPREATERQRSVPKLAANLATRVKLVRRAVAPHRSTVGGRGHRRLRRVPAIGSRIGLRRRGNRVIFMPHRSGGRSRAAWSGTDRSTRPHAATATAAGLSCLDAAKTQSAGQYTNRKKLQHDQFPSRKNVGLSEAIPGDQHDPRNHWLPGFCGTLRMRRTARATRWRDSTERAINHNVLTSCARELRTAKLIADSNTTAEKSEGWGLRKCLHGAARPREGRLRSAAAARHGVAQWAARSPRHKRERPVPPQRGQGSPQPRYRTPAIRCRIAA